MDLKPILEVVLLDYVLPLDGCHGVIHWARVLENGLRLSRETGAKTDVVTLFAVLHDARRVNEHFDPDHGPRAAEFAAAIRNRCIDLPDDDFHLLQIACEGHTHTLTHPDITVQTCWDADRLDLGRVGVTPHPSRLCTDVARRPDTIRWADGRASMGFVPRLIVDEWEIQRPSM